MHFKAHDFTTPNIKEEIEVEERTSDGTVFEISDVPSEYLKRSFCHKLRRLILGRRLGPSTVFVLLVSFENASNCSLGCKVYFRCPRPLPRFAQG